MSVTAARRAMAQPFSLDSQDTVCVERGDVAPQGLTRPTRLANEPPNQGLRIIIAVCKRNAFSNSRAAARGNRLFGNRLSDNLCRTCRCCRRRRRLCVLLLGIALTLLLRGFVGVGIFRLLNPTIFRLLRSYILLLAVINAGINLKLLLLAAINVQPQSVDGVRILGR